MKRLLLRLYPAWWRSRYGDELDELLTDTGVGPRVVADVVRSAAGEQRRALDRAITGGVSVTLGPAWRHPAGWAVFATVVLAPTAIFVIGSLLAYQLGLAAFANAMDSANAWLQAQPRIVDVLLVLAPLAAALMALVPLIRIELGTSDGERELGLSVRLRWLNLVVAGSGLAIGALLVWHIVWESVLEVGG